MANAIQWYNGGILWRSGGMAFNADCCYRTYTPGTPCPYCSGGTPLVFLEPVLITSGAGSDGHVTDSGTGLDLDKGLPAKAPLPQQHPNPAQGENGHRQQA